MCVAAGQSVTTPMWEAIYSYLGVNSDVKEKNSVTVPVTGGCQRPVNAVSGILALAYAMLIARGTPVHQLHRARFNEGQLLAWFKGCYQICDDSGSGSCLILLQQGVHFQWAHGSGRGESTSTVTKVAVSPRIINGEKDFRR